MRVFVSYKSEDCDVARATVETLMSAGVPTWFAEYEVLPSHYEAFDRDLEGNLQNAVQGCTHALVFTNNRWAESDYCRTEMQAITRTIPPGNIIEIRIPHEELPHHTYPSLHHGATLDYANDPQAIAMSVFKILGTANTPLDHSSMADAGSAFRLWRFGLEFDPRPLEASIVESNRASRGHGAPAVQFSGEIHGQRVKLAVVLNAFDSVLRSLQVGDFGPADDRKVYNQYREYAERWERDSSCEIHGLHLFFWNERSHLALTYVTRGTNGEAHSGAWERRYVLSPRGMTPAEKGEIHFIFYVPGIKGTSDVQLQNFAALCPTFDRVMKTVRYAPVSAGEDLTNSIPSVLVRAFYLSVCGWGVHALAPNPNLADWLILLAMIAGTIFADLAAILYSSVYRQIVWALATPPIEDSLTGAYSRITANIPMEITGYPVSWAMLLFTDLIRTLGDDRGTLRIPGPGVVWLVPAWFVLISQGYEGLGLRVSASIGFLAGFSVGLTVVLRFICYRIHGTNWGDLRLRRSRKTD